LENGRPDVLKEDIFIDEIEIWGVQEEVTLVLKDSTEQVTSFTQKVREI
jgi:hypothetical protein